MIKERDGIDKIDLLYKNLDHVMHGTYSAEAAFPYWETLYALIIGQLIIAYFQPNHFPFWPSSNTRCLISIIGLALSFFWYVLVNLNYIHSTYRADNIRQLEEKLIDEYKTLKDKNDKVLWCNLKFLPEDIPKHDRTILLSIKAIANELLFFREIRQKKEMLSSTWFYRKILPLITIVAWVSLLILSIKDP